MVLPCIYHLQFRKAKDKERFEINTVVIMILCNSYNIAQIDDSVERANIEFSFSEIVHFSFAKPSIIRSSNVGFQWRLSNIFEAQTPL